MLDQSVQIKFSREQEENQSRHRSSQVDLLVGDGAPLSIDEKEYQRWISEKLKSAADWDVRDSKSLSIR